MDRTPVSSALSAEPQHPSLESLIAAKVAAIELPDFELMTSQEVEEQVSSPLEPIILHNHVVDALSSIEKAMQHANMEERSLMQSAGVLLRKTVGLKVKPLL